PWRHRGRSARDGARLGQVVAALSRARVREEDRAAGGGRAAEHGAREPVRRHGDGAAGPRRGRARARDRGRARGAHEAAGHGGGRVMRGDRLTSKYIVCAQIICAAAAASAAEAPFSAGEKPRVGAAPAWRAPVPEETTAGGARVLVIPQHQLPIVHLLALVKA